MGRIEYKIGNPLSDKELQKVISKTYKSHELEHMVKHLKGKGYATDRLTASDVITIYKKLKEEDE